MSRVAIVREYAVWGGSREGLNVGRAGHRRDVQLVEGRTADFEEDAFVDDKCRYVIDADDAFGEKADGDPHVLFACHCCVEVKILGIGTHPSGIWSGDGAVNEQFEGVEVTPG